MQANWDVPETGKLDRACELILQRMQHPQGASDGASLAGAAEPVSEVRNLVIDGPLRLRLYLPAPRGAGLLVWLHGGGFVSGGLDSHDVPLRGLANTAGCAVLAVDYRRAPSHPFPAAIEDAHMALRWAAAQAAGWGCDPTLLAVGGDSAGGNLATVAAMLCRDRGPPLAMQILIYPDADARHGCNRESWRRFDGLVLGRADKDRTLDQYLPPEIDRLQPHVSPALASVESLRGLPAALVLTAEFDPQRDEGEAYAASLREAGVAVSLTRFAGMIHGFWQMGGLLRQAGEATRRIAEALTDIRRSRDDGREQ